MSFGKQVFSAFFAAMLVGSAGPALAQDREPANEVFVIEVYVHEEGTEIVCPTTACNAVCRDIEGTQVLLADTFYRIGSNCSLTITDGALLQEAIETVIALLGDEVPGGPGQQLGEPTSFPDQESNPNQNNPGLASPTEAGPVIP